MFQNRKMITGDSLESTEQICLGIFPARKQSLEKGNVFTHVCLFTGGLPQEEVSASRGGLSVSRGCLPLGGSASRGGGSASRAVCLQREKGLDRPPQITRKVGGTHPTGMLS